MLTVRLVVAVLTGLAMIPVLALLVWLEIPPVVKAGLIVLVPMSWVATKKNIVPVRVCPRPTHGPNMPASVAT